MMHLAVQVLNKQNLLLHKYFLFKVMEECQPKHRTIMGIVVALPWAIGTIVWGGLGYMIRDWRPLQLIISLPSLILIPLAW